MTKGLIDRDSSLRCFEKYYKNLSRLWFRVLGWLHCYEKSNCNSRRDHLSLLY